jgi:hypothetical protein
MSGLSGSLVARQTVHTDDVALRERGNKAFLHPVLEQSGVDRLVESLRRREAGKAQAGDQRDRLVMALRNGGAQNFKLDLAGLSENRFSAIAVSANAKLLSLRHQTNGDGGWAASADIVLELSRLHQDAQPHATASADRRVWCARERQNRHRQFQRSPQPDHSQR